MGKALRAYRGRLTGVGITGDLLYPPEEVLRWTRASGAAYRELSSPSGHDGFLLETDAVGAILAEAERISGMWQAGPWIGAVWEARGVLRQVEGDDAQARAMFREAAEAFERAGNRSDAERCLAAGRRNESSGR